MQVQLQFVEMEFLSKVKNVMKVMAVAVVVMVVVVVVLMAVLLMSFAVSHRHVV